MPIEVDQIGDSLNARAKHVDGEDFSTNYATDSITTTNIPFANLYAISNDLDGIEYYPYAHINAIHKINYDNGDLQPAIKKLLQDYYVDIESTLAFYPGMSMVGRLWKISRKDNDYYQEVIVEHFNVYDLSFDSTRVHFSYESVLPAEPKAMCYIGNDEFIIAGADGIYKMVYGNDYSTCTFLYSVSDVVGLATVSTEESPLVYAIFNNNSNLATIDTITGEPTIVGPVSPPTEGSTINYFQAITSFGGDLVCIYSLTNGDTNYYLGIIDPNNVSVSFVNSSYGYSDIKCLINFPIQDQEEDLLVAYTNDSSSVYDSASLFSINLDTWELDEKLIRFQFDEYYERIFITFNSSDKHLYIIGLKVCYGCVPPLESEEEEDGYTVFVFMKMNPYTLKIEDIGLSGFVAVPTNFSYNIDDGGNDMYDSGNMIYTNLTESAISYTHTSQSDYNSYENDFVEIADGQVSSGDDYFGSDSEYFTNMYTGLFVLAAYNININYISTQGNVGADGSGTIAAGRIVVTVNEHNYTIIYKNIYDSGDPSVNHLWILPGDINPTHDYDSNTDNDYDRIEGLSGINKVFYLLYAKAEGGQSSELEIENIATEFLNIIDIANNASECLSALNGNVGNITAHIESMYMFTDFADRELTEGIVDINAVTYDPVNDVIYAVGETEDDDVLVSINSSGVVSFIAYEDDLPFEVMTTLAIIRNKLMSGNEFESYIADVDKETGDALNPGENGKYDLLAYNEDNNISDISSLAGYGPYLLGIVDADNGGYHYASIDTEINVDVGESIPTNTNLIKPSLHWTSLAVELVPSEMRLIGVTGDHAGGYRLQTVFAIETSGVSIGEKIANLTTDYVEPSTSYHAFAYHDNHIWRMSLSYGRDENSFFTFEKINFITKQQTIVPSGFSDSSQPLAMIWNGYAFLVYLSDAIYLVNETGELSYIDSNPLLSINGLSFKYDEGVRTLYATAEDKIYIVDPDNGSIVNIDEETTFITMTVPDWTVSGSITSHFDNNTGDLLAICFLIDHATDPSGYYLVSFDETSGNGTIIFPMYPFRCLFIDGDNRLYGFLPEISYINEVQGLDGGAIYQVDSEGVDLYKRLCFGSYYSNSTITWNYDDLSLYHLGTYNETLIADFQSHNRFNKVNTHTGGVINIELSADFGTPKSLVYSGEGIFHACADGGFYSITSDGTVTGINEGTSFTSMTYYNGNLYAANNDSDKLYTIDTDTGSYTDVGTVTVAGHVVSGFQSIAYHNNLFYAIMENDNNDTFLITINLGTFVGTIASETQRLFVGMTSALAPVKATEGLPIENYFWDVIGDEKIYVECSSEPDISNMEAEIYHRQSVDFANPPSDGWERLVVLDKVQNESNWFIKLDAKPSGSVVRLRSRNPNTDWYYTQWD